MDVGIKIRAIGKAGGVGGKPAAQVGMIVTSSKMDEPCMGIMPFATESPGVA